MSTMRDMVIGFTIVIVLSMAMFSFAADWIKGNSSQNTSYMEKEYLEPFENLGGNASVMGDNIGSKAQSKEGIEDLEGRLSLIGFFEVAKIPFRIIKAIPNLIRIIAGALHIPPVYLMILGSLLAAVIGFMFISAFLRYNT